MIDWKYISRLMNCFPHSFINQHGEFIARRETNAYFRIDNCETEFDIKCKVLEWLSREAHKGGPFRSNKRNKSYQELLTRDINQYLGTSFTSDDMDDIYTYLGNACNHEKTKRFIHSGYDMSVLKPPIK